MTRLTAWTGGPGRQVWTGMCIFVMAAATAVAGPSGAGTAQVAAPKPDVPEFFTLEGEYVRLAYNHEGFITLGYRMAQEQVGEQWMLLQAGLTLLKPTKDYTLKRENISIKTADGKTIPLATQSEYDAAGGAVSSLNERAKVIVDSINYFPPDVTRGCALRFFTDDDSAPSWDQVELSYNRACMGRLYFKVPEGIAVGQNWLVVRFAGSTVEVPFHTMTKQEEKMLAKKWEDLKKAHEAAFGK